MIIRRVEALADGQQQLPGVGYLHFAFITDRAGDMLELEADHRQHAVVENVIRDLKHGLALNYMPSGRFGANAAWLALNVIAFNLTRWMGRLAGFADACLKTWRHRFLSLPARLVHRGRSLHPRLPRGWPWKGGIPDPAGQAARGRPAIDDLNFLASSPPLTHGRLLHACHRHSHTCLAAAFRHATPTLLSPLRRPLDTHAG